jgi:hypothetical protein
MRTRPSGTDGWRMDPALVSCTSCSRTWHSRTMADGLRAIGRCPRCGGELEWSASTAEATTDSPAPRTDQAPHLVLGVPRLG